MAQLSSSPSNYYPVRNDYNFLSQSRERNVTLKRSSGKMESFIIFRIKAIQISWLRPAATTHFTAKIPRNEFNSIEADWFFIGMPVGNGGGRWRAGVGRGEMIRWLQFAIFNAPRATFLIKLREGRGRRMRKRKNNDDTATDRCHPTSTSLTAPNWAFSAH